VTDALEGACAAKTSSRFSLRPRVAEQVHEQEGSSELVRGT